MEDNMCFKLFILDGSYAPCTKSIVYSPVRLGVWTSSLYRFDPIKVNLLRAFLEIFELSQIFMGNDQKRFVELRRLLGFHILTSCLMDKINDYH